MAETSDEEPLDSAANSSSERPLKEIIPAIPNQEIEIMEVHKHPHHVTHKKKWGEYLLEFLMLFLAVFLGFLAENLREHRVEHQRAQEYAANLYQELMKDTAGINKTIQEIKITTDKLDSFCLLATEKIKRNVTGGMLYYYASYTTSINLYASENTTIDQLKGSGNLRIMDNSISQLINVYEKKLKSLDNEYGLTRPEFTKIEELYFKIFDGFAIRQLAQEGDAQYRDSVNSQPHVRETVFKLTTPLINDDKAMMKELIGWLTFESQIYKSQIKNFLHPIKQTGTELMALLKKEYNLE